MYHSKLPECDRYPAPVPKFFFHLQAPLIHRNSLIVPALRLVYHSQMMQRSSLHDTCCSFCGFLIQPPHKIDETPYVERLGHTLHHLTCCIVFASSVEKPARFQNMPDISFLFPHIPIHLRSSDPGFFHARSTIYLLVQVKRKGAGVGVHLVQIPGNPAKQALVQQTAYPSIIPTHSHEEVLIDRSAVDRSAPEELLRRIIRQPLIQFIKQRDLYKFLLQFLYVKQYASYRNILRTSSDKVYDIRTAACFLVYEQLLFIGSPVKRWHVPNQPERLHPCEVRELY